MPREWGVEVYFREKEPEDLDTTGQGQEVIDFIAKKFHRIRSFVKFACKHDHLFNICLINKDNKAIDKILTPILKKYTCVLKVNVSAGHIAIQDNGKLRYMTATKDNFLLLRNAFEIKAPADIDKFYKHLLEANALDCESFKLATSKSRKILTTNLMFHVFCDHTRAQQDGSPPLDMGKWIDAQFVCCLKGDRNGPYRDNLCVFRAVVCFFKLLENPQFQTRTCTIRDVHALYHEYRRARDMQLPEHPIQYTGSYLETLKSLCIFKKINVIVFSDETVTVDEANTYANPEIFDFQGGSNAPLSRIIYRYVGEFDHTIHLIDYRNHCLLIKPGKLSSVLKQFACRSCTYNTTDHSNLKKHEKTCANVQKLTYRSGPFEVENPLFIRSRELRVPFPSGYEEYPYMIVWDIEVSLKPTHITSASRREDGTPGTVYSAQHDLLSIAAGTNFKHAEIPPVVCYVRQGDSSEDEEKVMDQALEYMHKVQKLASEHLHSKFEGYLERLNQEIVNEKQFEDEVASRISGMSGQEEEGEEEQGNRPQPKKVRLDKSPLVKLMEDVLKWLEQVPVLAFNGQKYDINVTKEYLLPKLAYLHGGENVNILKRGSSYMCITTPKLRLLDIMNYVGPSFSLKKFLSSFKAPAPKGEFPYEQVKSVADLRRTDCPPIEAFDSVLTGTKLDEATYQEHVVRPWRELNMREWGDFLVYYNQNDVLPTITAVENYAKEFPGTDPFKSRVSISGIAYYELFRTAPQDAKFFSAGEELYSLMRQNLSGGFVSATTRYFKADETRLRGAEAELVGGVRIPGGDAQADGLLAGGVMGKDNNSMYLKMTSGPMPTGPPIKYVAREDGRLQPKALPGTSLIAKQCLEYLQREFFPDLQTAYNRGEYKIGRRRFSADGYSAAHHTVVQFDGCNYHGHECCFPNNPDPQYLKTVKRRKAITEFRDAYTREHGLQVVKILECEWKAVRDRFVPRQPLMSIAQLIEKIQSDQLFGLVVCDVHVPEHLKSYYAQFPPVFKNVTVSLEDVGPHTKQLCERYGYLKKPQRTLITSFFGKQMLLTTSQIKWYLDHGLVVDKITTFYRFERKQPFVQFAEDTISARRAADDGSGSEVKGTVQKLKGNSAYGKSAQDPTKFLKTFLVDKEKDVCRGISNPRFHGLTSLGDGVYEISQTQRQVILKDPLQIAFFVYATSKITMLSYIYDFMDLYFPRTVYEICCTDTDSLYYAYAKNETGDIEDWVKPELRESYFRNRGRFLPSQACNNPICFEHYVQCKTNKTPWVQAPCCYKTELFHNRTPGLFKTEYEGEEICFLAPKTYCCESTTRKQKLSCKGVNKRINPLKMDDFLRVLRDGTKHNVVNRGFRYIDGKMRTYAQLKCGLSPIFIKRRVLDDGIHTEPLDL